jgi:hypothetical protein
VTIYVTAYIPIFEQGHEVADLTVHVDPASAQRTKTANGMPAAIAPRCARSTFYRKYSGGVDRRSARP